MPNLEPARCIIALVSVGDTSGLSFQCPSRCTGVQIYLRYTSGWANMGHFRCIAKECLSKIHRSSAIHSHPDVYQFISRDSTRFPLQRIPARASITLISREYTRIPSLNSQSKYVCVLNYHYQCSGCNKDATD